MKIEHSLSSHKILVIATTMTQAIIAVAVTVIDTA